MEQTSTKSVLDSAQIGVRGDPQGIVQTTNIYSTIKW